MSSKKDKAKVQVHILTEKALMKFIPTNYKKPEVNQPKIKTAESMPQKKQTKLISKFSLTNLLWRKNKTVDEQVPKSSDEQGANSLDNFKMQQPAQQQPAQQPQPQEIPHLNIQDCKLKYICRMANQHILIGNQFQLDLINILGINYNNYIQTEYLWSLKYTDQIYHVSVDQKKYNLLAIVAGNNLYIYKYDCKKMPEQPFVPFKILPLTSVPRFIQIAKDGNICVFYQQKAQIYLVGQDIRLRYNKPYKNPQNFDSQKSKFQLFVVPEPHQNVVNVFFEQTSEKSKVFTLWCVQFQFLASQIKQSPPFKIYDITKKFRNTLNIKNYSKELFLLNLGSQILALKKGYILDSANVNLKQQQSYLEYLGNETLLHISKNKIEVYTFFINFNIKPYRIIIKPRDSIKIQENENNDIFFKVINILSNDFMMIFQKGSVNSNSKSGQIHYSLYITRGVSRQNKMNQLFPRGSEEDLKIDDPVLIDKCDMAEKMGFTRKQIYLQLWNRSLKSRKQDYSILIATKDYNTIKQQVIRKLKKSSMLFKQIQNIQEACYAMLEQKVFSPSCTQQAVLDYVSSHFLKRKLQMFKDLQLMDKFQREQIQGYNQDNSKFKMTIRQYQEYKSMELKSELINLVNLFCHEDKKNLSRNIRFLLRNFKFAFRIIYYQVLDQIIKTAKTKLLDLLKQIPQLLPYYPIQQTQLHIPNGFYEGVWPEITRQQWNTSLYLDAITTIDNKEIILQQVIKNISFKRNWLSQHDVIVWSVQKIKQNYQKIKSSQTFYYFLAKMFQYIRDKQVLQKIVQFLQETYKLPQNVIGNVFLIERMYKFFVSKDIVPQKDGKPITLGQFFSFEDKQLIRHCFDKQRSNKGLLLKDIKDIYKQVLKSDANKKYNQALLNYFISDLSEVSDLKYILNRINNQKLEFHIQNQQMYEILVQAIQRKLKIGTDNDIPIQQVLIYVENIPLKFHAQASKSLQELKAIQKIKEQSQKLQQAKINMYIYDIIRDMQTVITKLTDYRIDNAPAQVWRDVNTFRTFFIKKLAEVENLLQYVYESSFQKGVFKMFCIKICQNIQRIKFVKYLLNCSIFQDRIEQQTAAQITFYMYNTKLSKQKQYTKVQQYMKQMFTLLPQNSRQQAYITNQINFAKLLSTPRQPVTYPINTDHLMSQDVRQIILDLPINFVMQIPIKQLFQSIKNIQDLLLEQLDNNDRGQKKKTFLSVANRTTLHQIYQFFIIKYIHSNKLKQVLPLIRQILQMQISDPTYNIVYIIMFIIHISSQFNENNRVNIIQCLWYYFYQPIKLLQIFQYVVSNPLSPKQIKQYIQGCVEEGKKQNKGYNAQNPLFEQSYLQQIHDKEDQHLFLLNLQKTCKHIQQSKQQFKNTKYSCIMIMICNSPYALAKFISCSYSIQINVKSIRSYLSYAVQEHVFKPIQLLQLGRRLFIVLLQAQKSKFPVEVMIDKYSEQKLDNQWQIQGYLPPTDKSTQQYLIWKSAQAFKKKKIAYKIQHLPKIQLSPSGSHREKSQIARKQLDRASQVDQRDPHNYIFNQIDSDNELSNIPEVQVAKKKRVKQAVVFNKNQELRNILKSKDRPNKLFLSTRGQIAKQSNNLMVSIRQPYKSNNDPGYQSMQNKNRKLKLQKHTTLIQKQIAQNNPGFIQDIRRSQCQTDRDEKLRPSHSVFDSQPRHSADSSPQILVHKNQTDRIVQKNIFQSQQMIQQGQVHHQKSNQNEKSRSHNQSLENPYAIKVKQVFDQDQMQQMYIEDMKIPKDMNIKNDFEEQLMMESTQFQNPVDSIVKKVLEQNKQALQNPLYDYNLSALQNYADDSFTLLLVLKQLYSLSVNNSSFPKIIKLLGQIIKAFPSTKINSQLFEIIIKAYQAQIKTIPQIKFSQFFDENSLFFEYCTKRQLFQKIYENLSKHVDSENIYKITQFIRRVFDDNPEFEQQVTWDFILELADRLKNVEEEDRKWNLEKITANLHKVDLSIWNRNINSFKNKIISSLFKDQLITIFCQYLAGKTGDEQAIQFLTSVQKLDTNPLISQTLKSITI